MRPPSIDSELQSENVGALEMTKADRSLRRKSGVPALLGRLRLRSQLTIGSGVAFGGLLEIRIEQIVDQIALPGLRIIEDDTDRTFPDSIRNRSCGARPERAYGRAPFIGIASINCVLRLRVARKWIPLSDREV